MEFRTIDSIETPALIIDMDALEYNIKKMSDYLSDKSAKLRPHFKTHKSPIIAKMQLDAGAKGLTCAKLGEAEVLATSGIEDILIANQIVTNEKICRLAGLARNARITVCVDNVANIQDLSEAALKYGSIIHVLIEIDVGMQRCGVDTKEDVLSLAKQIEASKGLVFEGFQAYAGQLSHNPDNSARVKGVEEAIEKISDIKAYLEKNSISVKEISGAGTGTHNITGNNTIWTEIQAGSYVFMDTDYTQLNLGFKESLSILTTVIHKNNSVAITDAGQKACCMTAGYPTIKGHSDLFAVLSEEHGKIIDDNDELQYLQRIEYIPSHCCTTANLHDFYYCVRNGLWEATWPVAARGRYR